MGNWRKLHNEKLTICTPLLRRSKQENTDLGWRILIKNHLKEIVCDVVDWIRLAQDRDKHRTLVVTVINH